MSTRTQHQSTTHCTHSPAAVVQHDARRHHHHCPVIVSSPYSWRRFAAGLHKVLAALAASHTRRFLDV